MLFIGEQCDCADGVPNLPEGDRTGSGGSIFMFVDVPSTQTQRCQVGELYSAGVIAFIRGNPWGRAW